MNPTRGFSVLAINRLPRSRGWRPSGRFLFAGFSRDRKNESSGLAALTIDDDATGALTRVPGPPSSTGSDQGPLWRAIAPSGRFLYSAHTQATLLTVHAIDLATGALSPAPVATHFTGNHLRAFPRWLSLDRSGRFLYATALASLISPSPEGWVLVYRVDETTGELKALPSVHLSGKPAGLAVVGPHAETSRASTAARPRSNGAIVCSLT